MSTIKSLMSTLTVPALDPTKVFIAALASVVLLHLGLWALDTHHIRSYPGPLVAKFTDLWLGYVAYKGHRSEVVHELHRKYGPFVRLAPNHVSVALPEALNLVYGHGNSTLKSNFYDAFVSIQRGLFTSRDRQQHARKRKLVSHVFSRKSVLEFEPHILTHIDELLFEWDRLHDLALKGRAGAEGEGWSGHDGRLWLDCLPWMNYLAFDTIGDLAFGAPFGMVKSGKDSAMAPRINDDALKSYGKELTDSVEVPAVKVLNDRGDFSSAMGVLPPWLRPLVRKLPIFSVGREAAETFAGIAIMSVAKRLAIPSDRGDLLSILLAGKDETGAPLGAEEITAEALTLLIAGSDTTSNSTSAILYYLARNRPIQEKLQQELDEHLSEPVATAEQVAHLPYLQACIDEALRIHSASALGLPRVVPAGGLTIMGNHFVEGTVLSVPSFTIHRDQSVWGDDADVYRPERWFELDHAQVQKAFNPFSVGPRACVGRNLATLELQLFVASLVHRYDFVLENPDAALPTREGFLRKPLGCRVGIKRREVL